MIADQVPERLEDNDWRCLGVRSPNNDPSQQVTRYENQEYHIMLQMGYTESKFMPVELGGVHVTVKAGGRGDPRIMHMEPVSDMGNIEQAAGRAVDKIYSVIIPEMGEYIQKYGLEE